MENLTVYHASTCKNCELIIKTKKFNVSTSSESLYQSISSGKDTYQWLGDGIYFWVNDLDMAKRWSKKVHRWYNNPTGIIKVELGYLEERCFDLRQSCMRNIVLNTIENLIQNNNTHLDFKKMHRDDKNKFIGFACDFFFKKGKDLYDLVYYDFLIEEHPILPKYTAQICVKNDKVIKYHKMEII